MNQRPHFYIHIYWHAFNPCFTIYSNDLVAAFSHPLCLWRWKVSAALTQQLICRLTDCCNWYKPGCWRGTGNSPLAPVTGLTHFTASLPTPASSTAAPIWQVSAHHTCLVTSQPFITPRWQDGVFVLWCKQNQQQRTNANQARCDLHVLLKTSFFPISTFALSVKHRGVFKMCDLCFSPKRQKAGLLTPLTPETQFFIIPVFYITIQGPHSREICVFCTTLLPKSSSVWKDLKCANTTKKTCSNTSLLVKKKNTSAIPRDPKCQCRWMWDTDQWARPKHSKQVGQEAEKKTRTLVHICTLLTIRGVWLIYIVQSVYEASERLQSWIFLSTVSRIFLL